MLQDEWENLASLLSLGIGCAAGLGLWLGVLPAKSVAYLERSFSRLALSRGFCFVLVPFLSLAVNIGIGMRNGIPHAFVHDEFSYLLAADTFSHGRLTNPTPPFYEHFETPHELMKPTYMSKYPPGQGLAMAVGQVTVGLPIVGVWISSALAVTAIYWMLLGAMPREWALLGGIVAALHPQFLYWSQSYWGGSVAVLGGALLLGAWWRLMTVHSNLTGIMLGVGLIILANSRPLEGLALAVPLMAGLGFKRRAACLKLLAPAGIPLLLGAIWMGYYNYRVTGNIWRLPYTEYVSQYEIYPKAWFLPPRTPPIYHNNSIRFVHETFDGQAYHNMRSWVGLWVNSEARFQTLFSTNLPLTILIIPFAIAVFRRQSAMMWWVILAATLGILTVWSDIFFLEHYLAPMMPVFFLLTLCGWIRLHHLKWKGRAWGLLISRATAFGVLGASLFFYAEPAVPHRLYVEQQHFVESQPRLATGKHLIFVRYAPLHVLHNEYVYNAADMNSSNIIWARYFGPESDRPVAEFFKGRQVWLLNIGGTEDLKPYLQNPS